MNCLTLERYTNFHVFKKFTRVTKLVEEHKICLSRSSLGLHFTQQGLKELQLAMKLVENSKLKFYVRYKINSLVFSITRKTPIFK